MTSHVLTLAEPEAERVVRTLGGSGQGDLLRELSKTPLARAEFGKPKGIDTAHLSRFDGTDYCQWYGRRADGRFWPFGRVMKIVEVADGRA